MSTRISRIEYYLPQKVVTNKELEIEFPEWDSAKIESKTGIKERHIAAENETALDLGYHAAELVLKDFPKEKIDFLIFCTQSPDYFLPTSACILQNKLQLNRNIGAFDFNLGCSGFVYGLAIAKGLIQSGSASCVLLVTAETYNKHIHKKDKANRTIFGDGAAACIISGSDHEKILNFDLGTDGEGSQNLMVTNGGLRNPKTTDATESTDENGLFFSPDYLYMNGPEIFNFTIRMIPKTIQSCLEKNNTTLEQIDYVVFHQANQFMLTHLQHKLKIPAEKFYINLEHTGNTVSASIPVALKDALDKGLIKSGDKVLIAGFGVGYSWGTTIIEI